MTTYVESIQLVVFTDAPVSADAGELWLSVWGARPANFATVAPDMTHASTTIGNLDVILQSQLGRIDLVATGKNDFNPIKGKFAVIHDLKGALDLLTQKMKQIAKIQGANRVAVVLQSFDLSDSFEDSVKLLSLKVPNLPCKSGAVDLQYQTTTRVKSKVHDSIEINRLAKWFTGVKITFQFNVNAGIPGQINLPQQPQQSVMAAMIDISTMPGARLPTRRISALIDEIRLNATEVLEHGIAAL